MNVGSRQYKLVTEEIKATKLFLWLFYIIFLSYDIFYYFILPQINKGREVGLPKEGLGYWLHLIVLGLIPVAIYLLKGRNPYFTKYLIFISYNLLDFINALMIYIGNDIEFESGNVVELFFILFTALFMSKRFFWIVYGTIITKYIVYAIILHDTFLLLGIVILTVLASISYLFLYRSYSYINTLEKVNEELRHKEKLALVGQLATSIAHEIRNPLSALKGFTQLQQEKYPHDIEFFEIMENEIERINLIVNDLMYIGKPKSLIVDKHEMKELIQYVIAILNPIARTNNVKIHLNMGEHPKVNSDGNQLKQVFINLVKNAIESMPFGGNITISSEIIENELFAIFIEDEGHGIQEEKLGTLGEPFYTTKHDGNGLGLMVTFNIIEQHGGKIVFNSKIGKGTKVEVYLPIDDSKSRINTDLRYRHAKT